MSIRYYLSFIIIAIVAVSCTNKYENAIAEYVQTIEGTKVDLSFELKEAKEAKKITVADSISILNKEAESILTSSIKTAEDQLTEYQQNLVEEQTKRGVKNKTMIDAYMKAIATKQSELDSLKTIKPTPISQYEGRKADEVLAIIVNAKYKVKNPLLDNNETEVTAAFILSPDGKKCYSQISDAPTTESNLTDK